MLQKKCPLCTKVKGKRGCLLNANALICSQCCAQIRNNDCEGCSYYKESQQFAIEKAKKSPKHFIARIDPAVDEQVDDALTMLNAGNIFAAEQSLNSLEKKHPDIYTVYFGLGTLYGYKQEYDKAIAYFDKSLDIYPYFVDCWFNRLIAAKNKLDIPEMVFSAQKVIEFGIPTDEPVIQAKDLLNTLKEGAYNESGLDLETYVKSMKLFNQSFDFMQNKEWEKAIVTLKKIIAINSNNAPTFGNLGICYMSLGENEKAIEAFDQAMMIDSGYEPAIINREILKHRIANDIPIFDVDVKAISYGKDYSLKDDKRLIDDYLNETL